MVILMTGVRLMWAMPHDERSPGYQLWHRIVQATKIPLVTAGGLFVVAEGILVLFALHSDAAFSQLAAATQLPAVIYAVMTVLYIAKRKELPVSRGFTLGRFETPIIVWASVWLIFELLSFRDASFHNAWLYVLVMCAIGAVYLVSLLIRRGGPSGILKSDLYNIDAALEVPTGGTLSEDPAGPDSRSDRRQR